MRMPLAASRRARRRGSEVNVRPLQRAASALAGGVLLALGLRRRSVGGAALVLAGGDLLYRGATGYCHLLGALRIDTSNGSGAPVQIQRSITVQLPRHDAYARWRDAATQPLVWAHFAELTNATERGAHWLVRAPLGRTLEWDATVVEERSPELIRWQTTEAADVPNEGSVEFRDAPGEHGTELTLRVRFEPPAGAIGEAGARVFDDAPKLVLEKALRRFKQLVETGEIASNEHNPTARTT